MSPNNYTEDKLVQKTTADYFEKKLNWESIYAYNDEVLGKDGTLGRESEKEIILFKFLRSALEKLNTGLPDEAYDNAIRQITESSASKSLIQTNKDKYELFKKGVLVQYKNDKGEIEKNRLRVFDFENAEENHFLIVRELWIQGSLYRRRPDILGFVNGIPLLFIELKNIHKDLKRAYFENLSDYKDTIPEIFYYNAIAVLSNGNEAKVGSFSAKYDYFHEWKRLEEDEKGAVDMETLLKGMFTKKNFMDIFENFIVYDESTGKTSKILAKNHQFLGVNKAIDAVINRKEREGKLGVFWHTQGSGKSYSMVFFSEKVRRKLKGNFTFLILTDRDDLDTQIYKTYAGCGIVDNDTDNCRAASGDNLKEILRMDKPYVFSMIHKFNKQVEPDNPYNTRDDIIVMTDEAHRTQYGLLALNMRNALPEASYIGFTGTPLFKDDEITKKVFGDYVSTYDFQKAVIDNATVPLKYDNRGEKLQIGMNNLNEKVAQKLEEFEFDIDQQAALERELGRDYHVFTAEERLIKIAKDFVNHYTNRWGSGKAMIVCIDKVTTLRMYNLIKKFWDEKIKEETERYKSLDDDQDDSYLSEKINWLKETELAVVISEEQGEVDLFRKWDIDIKPHREKIKKGLKINKNKWIEIDSAFKDPEHKFRVAIVCAMWLTGFDVPSLSVMYLDKPLKAHTLMQAIARANRVYQGKNNGLIVDYCGILKNLRESLATFTTKSECKEGDEFVDPVRPEEELIDELKETINEIINFFKEKNFELKRIIETTGFEKNAAIVEAKELVNQNEESRKNYEILAREVFKKFKACINIPQVREYREKYGAINIIYKELQEDREKADISHILKELQGIVDETIATIPENDVKDEDRVYDISKIDFQKLQQEFAKSKKKYSTVYNLKELVEKKLKKMISKNPKRMDLYKRYQEIIAEYNLEKDRVMIEKTFAELMEFEQSLNTEEKRAIKEGLDEDSLALFDLLEKPNLRPAEREKIKRVAKDLYSKLKSEYMKIQGLWDKDSTKSDMKIFIKDFLYNDNTGLPHPDYTTEEVYQKAEMIYNYLYRQYEEQIRNCSFVVANQSF
ncbi:MAG TPA: type I restriction endonuclease subunit R [Ignavibacteria bacterium]|nr:type I restriction endonuclease subunit R [Ignavibacteria bacterium]